MSAIAPCACSTPGSSTPKGQGGAGGGGECPVRPPEPQFIVDIRTDNGPLPLDTRITVEWSAADEPPFVLADPTTWKTLDDGVNLVCRIDRTKPPPTDLNVLVCELWTSGAVNLLVQATGFNAHAETLEPVMNEKCDQPMPADIAVVLSPEMLDGGPMP